MPLKWFFCPDMTMISVEDCLKENGCRRADRCATRSYLRMVSKERIWTGKPSTTQLISGTMCSFLKLTNEYASSSDQRAFMINGTNAHAKLEDCPDEYSLLEEKFQESDISGIADVIEKENGKIILADYKTSGSYRVARALGMTVKEEPSGEFYKTGKRKGEEKMRKILVRDPEAVDVFDWSLQLGHYRILYEKKYGVKVDEIRIQCIVRDGGTYMANSRGVVRNVYYFKLPMLSDGEILEYFTRKKNALATAMAQGFWDEICDGKENWDGVKCARYCEVAEFCRFGKYLKKEREAEEMAIKGLSEVRRLPRLGKIRLGIKKKNDKGKEYPAEVDYFILDPETPDELGRKNLIDDFHKLFGENPKSIRIMFPVADREVVFPQFYKRYGSSTMLQCKGNGIEATCVKEEFAQGLKIIGKDETGMPLVECNGKDCPYYKANKCVESGLLQFLVPELPGSGVWQIPTGSIHNMININSGIDYITAVAGRAHMIPLVLERRETEVPHDGVKTKHYLLNLNFDKAVRDLQKLARIRPEEVMLLPEPKIDPEELLDTAEVLDPKTGELIPGKQTTPAEPTPPAAEELPEEPATSAGKHPYVLSQDQLQVLEQFYKPRVDWNDQQKTLARNICEELLKRANWDIKKAIIELEGLTTFPSQDPAKKGQMVPGISSVTTLSGKSIERLAKKANVLAF